MIGLITYLILNGKLVGSKEIFITLIIFGAIEILLAIFKYFVSSKIKLSGGNIEPIASKKNKQVNLINDNVQTATPVDVNALMKDINNESRKELISFVIKHVGKVGESSGKGLLIDWSEKTKLSYVSEPISLLVNLNRLNDVRRLGRHISICYQKLLTGGWLVVKYLPLHKVKENLRKNTTKPLTTLIMTCHFMFYRVFPKIPYLNKLYFFLTNGKNRVLSKAEVWGRLHYNGFNVVDEISIGNYSYIIAQKVRTHSEDKTPSFYPIIRLARVGLDGKIIMIHKVRSMHPFSEYIQEKIYEINKLANSGKLENDFRVTDWGGFVRKYWIDEVPQIIDWLRGDIKLVGIRALSLHFFSLYPKFYKELFVKVKPGLIPPLMDESVTDFDKIVEIESKYLREYLKNPIKTDWKYFWLAMYDIFLKGVRSA
jgi:lipopolysaccharide/colanic/teichoic acid biosynthesis glycosyltransferase